MMTIIETPDLEKYVLEEPPPGFKKSPADGTIYVYDCTSITNSLYGLRVIMSASIEEDARIWLHISMSRRNKIPSYEDMITTKRLFVGENRYAYQVFPPEDQYYSNPGKKYDGRGQNVLHLWAPHDPDVSLLPNFLKARGGTI